MNSLDYWCRFDAFSVCSVGWLSVWWWCIRIRLLLVEEGLGATMAGEVCRDRAAPQKYTIFFGGDAKSRFGGGGKTIKGGRCRSLLLLHQVEDQSTSTEATVPLTPGVDFSHNFPIFRL